MSVAQSVDVQSDKVSFQPVVEDKQGLCCPDLIHHCGARTEKRITEKSDIRISRVMRRANIQRQMSPMGVQDCRV